MLVIFCLPGRNFSSNYFNSWNQTVQTLQQNNIQFAYSMTYDPVVYFTRNKILGGDNRNGKNQKPWQNQLKYDKIVWIDSDIVWQPSDVIKLITSDKPIIAGTYLMSSGKEYPLVENLDYTQLATSGHFSFITPNELQHKTEPFTVNYTGFGFICMSYGVLESMQYPWFYPRWISNENFHDFCAEDVGFCWAAQELGYKIWVDPSIIVGHEKSVIL